jgi:hypothetical protein
LPIGARFKIVNLASGKVLDQEWCEKTSPGIADNRTYNALQPASTTRYGGRKVFSILLRDDDPVELPPEE